MVERYIDENKHNIIDSIIKTVSYKSVYTKSNIKDAPFGEECKNVLNYVLSLGKSMGFKTKNIDGYCGYIEFGEGKEMLGIIGHLDVVPANPEDGWTSDPFKAEIRNNKIYGRGTIDDKGPVISCLYAMKAVSKNIKLNKRVRLILGLNEENDWKCIKRYKETEELPTISFSPDANFPCIYAEKGIITMKLIHSFQLKDAKIIEISSGNNAINVVPKTAYIILEVTNKEKYQKEKDIQIKDLGNNIIKITATGKSAHASFPNLGDNAITKLLKYLNKVSPSKYIQELLNKEFFELENLKYLGGKSLKDESGSLTSNIGIVKYENKNLILEVNLRVPIDTTIDEIKEKYNQLTTEIEGLTCLLEDATPKLYVDKDSYLVETLTKVFNEATSLNEKPLAIGGGTYAKAFDNCVSFGMTMPGEEDLCHQVNESVNIDNLMLATKIYARAIIELTK